MKSLFFLILIISPSIIGSVLVPEKLLTASKAFSENPSLHPVYRIDLIIFFHKDLKERNLKESFSNLDTLTYSNDLLKLSQSSSLLVMDQAIKEGLAKNDQVIKTVKFSNNKKEENIEDEANKDKDSTINNYFLPYEYFVLLEDNNTQTKTLVKKLDISKEYEVLFYGNWFQPLFNKEFASPVYIHADNQLKIIHGELLLYKEKYLHSEIRLRLAEKSDLYEDRKLITLYDFNSLLKLYKAENKFINFFKSIGEEVTSFSNWIFRSKEFSPVTSNNENNLVKTQTYYDKYEIIQETKMKDSEFHYIDHPFFGVVLRISLWEGNKE